MTPYSPAPGTDAAFPPSQARRSTARGLRPWAARAQVGSVALARSTAFGGILALKGGAFETRLEPHVHSSYVFGVVDDGAVEVTANGVSAIPPRTALPARLHTCPEANPGRAVAARLNGLADALRRGTDAGIMGPDVERLAPSVASPGSR